MKATVGLPGDHGRNTDPLLGSLKTDAEFARRIAPDAHTPVRKLVTACDCTGDLLIRQRTLSGSGTCGQDEDKEQRKPRAGHRATRHARIRIPAMSSDHVSG
jgi:hypothetical protein